jgi:hypothetical protein
MRGVFLWFVYCIHWRDKLIAHSSLGCYTILFVLAVYLKSYGPNRNTDVKGPLFIISVFLYLSCSTQFALEFSHFYKALVRAIPHSNHTISEYHRRIPQVLKDSQWRQTTSLEPASLSQSRIFSENLSLSTAVGCCGPRIIGSSSFRVLLQFRS